MVFKKKVKDEFKTVVIIIGAILSCIAPFFHIVFPIVPDTVAAIEYKIEHSETYKPLFEKELILAKEEAKVMGFNSTRKFWYAIGKSITMFYFSFVIMLSLRSIGDKYMRKALQVSSIILMTIAVYFITWALWAAGDFPKTYYYIIIGVISILSTWMSFSLIQHFSRVQLMVKRLLDYIIIQIDDKYIPKDKKEAYLKDYMEQIKKL